MPDQKQGEPGQEGMFGKATEKAQEIKQVFEAEMKAAAVAARSALSETAADVAEAGKAVAVEVAAAGDAFREQGEVLRKRAKKIAARAKAGGRKIGRSAKKLAAKARAQGRRIGGAARKLAKGRKGARKPAARKGRARTGKARRTRR